MTDKNKFIFNDESVENSYGFSVVTSGIGLTRFKNNPVMLDSHYNSNSSVIGKWENIESSEGLLMGTPVFDTDDEKAKVIAGKVERGFIKACSMGIIFKRDDLQVVGGKLILTKCELFEVSIVAVPSNANAIRLYNEAGDLLSEEQVQQLCLSLTNNNKNQEKTDMKIVLTMAAATALGFTDNNVDAEQLSAKIEALELARKSAESELSTMKAEKEQQALSAIQEKVSNAVKLGQITADKQDEFVQLGVANPTLLDSTLAAIPVKKKFKDGISNADLSAVKTIEDFQKLSLEEQLAFKNEQPAAYVKLFKRK